MRVRASARCAQPHVNGYKHHAVLGQSRRILNQVEAELSKKPDSYPVLKGEFAGLRKFRVGDYRIIYALIDENVVVLRIGHRRDVYK